MGRCHEFGSQIREGCSHPMRAGERACACPECGVVCQGQFDGCPDVWARGPRPITFTSTPVITAPRVRALAAGADPVWAQPPPPIRPPQAPPPIRPPQVRPPQPPPAANGNGNGARTSAPPPPPPPPPTGGAARTEILEWFEEAFDELRNELHAVVSAVTRQQAMLAELLDSREAELRVVMVAESLPELAGEAAAKALTDQSDGLAEIVAASLDDFRAAMAASELSGAEVMDGMRELLRRVELTAEVNTDDARFEGAARLEALKASVGRQLKPLSAGLAEVAAYMELAEEREAARAKALKASITRQVQPLAATVEAAVERSDRQLAEIHARLDALGSPKVRAARAAAPKPATAPKPRAVRTATPPVARKASAKATRAAAPKARTPRRADPDPESPESAVLYDYEAPATPPAPGLLTRRKPAPRRPPLG